MFSLQSYIIYALSFVLVGVEIWALRVAMGEAILDIDYDNHEGD